MKARRRFRRLIRTRPTSSRGYRGLGLLASRQGDWASAVRWFTRAVDVAPRARWPRVNRIDALRVVGDLDAADADVQAFLQDDPDFGPLNRFRSRLAADRDDLATALTWARLATDVDRSDAWGFIEVARVAARMGRHDEAFAAVDSALALRPGMPEAYRCRATSLGARGQTDAAVAALREGADANPRDLWCLLELADLYRRRGLHQAALEACDTALKRRPLDANALRYRSWVMRDLGDLWRAEADLREAVAALPLDSVQRDLADNLRRQRRYDESIAIAEQALQRRVRRGLAHVKIALTLRSRHQTGAAEGRLGLAIEDAPGDVWPRLELVDLLRQQERYDDALRVLEETVSRFPRVTAVKRRWAAILSDRGDPSGAAAKFEEIVAAAPYDVDSLIEAVDFHRKRSALAPAAELAKKAVHSRPDLPASWRCRARVLEDLDDLVAAEADLRSAVAAAPGDVWARADLCSTLRRWGRWDDAAVIAEDLVSVRPDSPEGWLQWAWTCWSAGDTSTAEQKFQKALAAAAPHDVRPQLRYAAWEAAERVLDRLCTETPSEVQDLVAWAKALEKRDPTLALSRAALQRARAATAVTARAPELVAAAGPTQRCAGGGAGAASGYRGRTVGRYVGGGAGRPARAREAATGSHPGSPGGE